MEISENSIFIAGITVAGMFLGLKAFIRMSEELGTMPTMIIGDYPNIPFRAIQWCGKRPDENVRADFAEKWYK